MAEIFQENPILKSKAGREFQILCLDALSRLQYAALGSRQIGDRASNQFKRKSIWKDIRKIGKGLFSKILGEQKQTDRPETDKAEMYDQWLFDFLGQNWNHVYEEIGKSGSFLGYLSGYLSGQLQLPTETVEGMGIQDYDVALKHKLGVGLDDPEQLSAAMSKGAPGIPPLAWGDVPGVSPERTYVESYAQRAGAQWVAVYDESGQRAGRAYEVISGLFRKQVAEAIANGETLGQIRSRLVFPDLLESLEKGEITEDEFIQWTDDHLNRDFSRFAVTEAAYAFNNGRIMHRADVAKITGIPTYVRFARGVNRSL